MKPDNLGKVFEELIITGRPKAEALSLILNTDKLNIKNTQYKDKRNEKINSKSKL